MTSAARIAANQGNAQASTGPKSAEGKAKSRKNAIVHGLAGRQPTALGEDEAAFRRYCDAMAAAVQPQNAVEAALVHRMAMCGWRLERLYRIEAVLLDKESHQHHSSSMPLNAIPLDVWPEQMPTLARYEAMLDRGFQRALAELQKLRSGSLRLAAPQIEELSPSVAAETSSDPSPLEETAASNSDFTERSQSSAAVEPRGGPPSPAAAGIETNFTKRTQFDGPVAEGAGRDRPP